MAPNVDRLAREQPLHRLDALAHLRERAGRAPDGARGGVARADHEAHPPRRQLLHRLDGARQHGGVPGERVGDGGEERHAARVRGGLPQHDEGVAAQELAVEDAGAVEAGRLDVLDERIRCGMGGCRALAGRRGRARS